MHAQPPEVRAVFDRALEIAAAAERQAYLDRIGRDFPEVRARVEQLLHAYAEAGSFLKGVTRDEPSREEPGAVIGPYKLLQQIGEGGMGVVFMAEQQEPVRRRVALKIIKPGMDSAQVIARFEAERQALALMDHQNIARVLEAGTTERGRPYFVMELVHGVPITRYCDDNKLTLRQRLELFVPVCQAVQHAHQKGIIHRDLKPSNILVTLYDGKPVPKVIDFGVAKATEQRLTERTLFTQYGTIVGTFEYMAPEQAEMSALGVDTRSDVYSLGVLLYELLTGTTPLEPGQLRGAVLSEMLRLIREEEPPRPSARISTSGEALATISQQRNTEAAQLAKLVRGELDWIVMMALEKDRTQRYESASGLARDVERYLADEPVEACPPSAGYRLSKFVRKHRQPLAVAAAFALLLLAAAVVSSWQAVQATLAKEDAVRKSAALAAAEADVEAERNELQEANAHLRDTQDSLRETLYFARSTAIQSAWESNNVGQVLALLEQQRPAPGQRDLRGFEWHYRDRLCHLDSLTIDNFGPEGPAWDEPKFSPDGRYVLALARERDGGAGCEYAVYDLNTGRERSRLHTVEDYGWSQIVWSGDGQRVLLDSSPAPPHARGPGTTSTLMAFDTATGREAYRVNGSDFSGRGGIKGFDELKFSKKGNALAVVANRRKEGEAILVFDALTGKPARTIPTKGYVLTMGLSPDGKRVSANVYARPGEGAVQVWDVATGDVVFRADKLTEPTPRLTFSPDGSRLAAASRAGVRTWDLVRGKGLLTATPRSPSGQALGFAGLGSRVGQPDDDHYAFSPDGSRLATIGSAPGVPSEVQIWDFATGRAVESWRDVEGARLLQFSPDGRRLATAGGDPVARVWDLGSQHPESDRTPALVFRSHRGRVAHLGFSPDGARLLTSGEDGVVKVWDLAVTDPSWTVPGVNSVTTPVGFNGSAGRIVTVRGAGDKGVAEDQDVTIRDLEGKALHSYRLSFPGPNRRSAGYPVTLSPDGRRLATDVPLGDFGLGKPARSEGVELRVFAADTGERVYSCKERRPIARAGNLVFSRDGQRLAWAVTFEPPNPEDPHTNVSEVKVLDAANGKQLTSIAVSGDGVGSMAFSPDGSCLAIASAGLGLSAGDVSVWDAAGGKKLFGLEGNWERAQPLGLVYSPDGTRLLAIHGTSFRAGATIDFWDADSGHLVRTLKGHAEFTHLALSPDGRRLALGSVAHTMNLPGRVGSVSVKVWDAATGNELLALNEAGRGELKYLTFSPDGRRLYAASLRVGSWGGGGASASPLHVTVWDATPRPEK